MEIKTKLNEASGSINAPSSKSYTQRYVLYSAFSNKKIKLNNINLYILKSKNKYLQDKEILIYLLE